MQDWREQEAANQTRFRDVNESIGMDLPRDPGRSDEYVCECGDAGCREPIHLSLLEYEAVRSRPTHFAIALNHENPEIDRVIAEYERYAVVEKTLAATVKIARETDPRAWRGPEREGGSGGAGTPASAWPGSTSEEKRAVARGR
jgi:hypothetical protein